LTVQQVATLLKLSRATVYRLCETGELPAVKLLNNVRIDSERLFFALGGQERETNQ
jgi:excisionase family DNA binding protein